MKTNNDHLPNKSADFVIDRDIFGQIKNLKISAIKKFKYKPINAPELNVSYVNLGARTIATLLDLFIAVSLLIVAETFMYSSSIFNMELNMFRVLGGVLIWVFYNSILESSVFQATIGKMTLKIQVVDMFGNRLGFLRAMVRCISTVISIMPFGYGIWSITTDPKKQSWHDLISGTFVIKQK